VRVYVSIAFALCVVAFHRDASAFEHQQHFGGDIGGSAFSVNGQPTFIGAGLGLHYTYGLTDQFNLMTEASTTHLTLKENVGPTQATSVAVGASYVLDVLRWVPYGGVLIGATYMNGGPIPTIPVLLDAQIAVGLDYQIDRNLAVGVAGRQHMLLTDLSTYPSFTTVFFRVEYVWGY
jgi:hypothetical protein